MPVPPIPKTTFGLKPKVASPREEASKLAPVFEVCVCGWAGGWVCLCVGVGMWVRASERVATRQGGGVGVPVPPIPKSTFGLKPKVASPREEASKLAPVFEVCVCAHTCGCVGAC